MGLRNITSTTDERVVRRLRGESLGGLVKVESLGGAGERREESLGLVSLGFE